MGRGPRRSSSGPRHGWTLRSGRGWPHRRTLRKSQSRALRFGGQGLPRAAGQRGPGSGRLRSGTLTASGRPWTGLRQRFGWNGDVSVQWSRCWARTMRSRRMGACTADGRTQGPELKGRPFGLSRFSGHCFSAGCGTGGCGCFRMRCNRLALRGCSRHRGGGSSGRSGWGYVGARYRRCRWGRGAQGRLKSRTAGGAWFFRRRLVRRRDRRLGYRRRGPCALGAVLFFVYIGVILYTGFIAVILAMTVGCPGWGLQRRLGLHEPIP